MNDQSDAQLLRAYAERRSETAFAELVRRHIDLVYSAAQRMVGSSHQAEDVTQGVFVALAKNAAQLTERPSLSGWLYCAAQNIAAQAVRTDVRRRVREQEAVAMNELLAAESDTPWENIAPHLDQALGQLNESDRDALLLRYFEKKSAREISGILGVSEEAAQKRVSRAVERLRESFAQRGLAVGAGGLVLVLSVNAVQAAPAGLAGTISTAALAGTAATAFHVIAAVKTTSPLMKITTATKLKFACGMVAVVVAMTVFILQQQNQARLHGETELLQQKIAQLQAENTSLSNRLDELGEAKKMSAAQFNELLKLRGEVGVFRRQLAGRAAQNVVQPDVNGLMSGSITNSFTPQIHIKSRFITMPVDVFAGLDFSTLSLDQNTFTGILTSQDTTRILRELRSEQGVEILAAPEMVLTSGQQAQMRATQVINVVTNFIFRETNNTTGLIPQTEAVDTGPVLDVIPSVLPDGNTIELPIITTEVDFLGYQPAANPAPTYGADGQQIGLSAPSPQFHIQQSTNSVDLPDNQTLFFALSGYHVSAAATSLEPDGSASKPQDSKTLVFVTATIIDPAGNRVHTDAGK